MKEFTYTRAADAAGARTALAVPGTQLLAGGTELLNWLRDGIETPDHLVDITALPLRDLTPLPGGGLRIGALARMSDVAAEPRVVRDFPALAEALERSASPQLRNMATLGGNLQQRTRCPYFRAETGTLPCNKRTPGSGCGALESGETEEAAVLGWTTDCVATHPSDMAVALAALDASAVLEGPDGERRVPVADFHLTPEQAPPERHSVLAAGELITAVELPAPAPLSHYVKVRRRASYEFALVSAAAAVTLEAGRLATARLALGGVAHRAWRLPGVQEALSGLDPEDQTALYDALGPALAGARTLPRNAHKPELARRAAVRALRDAARRAEGSPR